MAFKVGRLQPARVGPVLLRFEACRRLQEVVRGQGEDRGLRWGWGEEGRWRGGEEEGVGGRVPTSTYGGQNAVGNSFRSGGNHPRM